MQSLRELYKIGVGPSSSHTMGPVRAAREILAEYPTADFFRVTLYGSLSATGRGHMTDRALVRAFAPKKCEVVFGGNLQNGEHPNTMDFEVFRAGERITSLRVLSIGGGSIKYLGRQFREPEDVYPHKNFAEIADYCRGEGIRLSDYAVRFEGEEIRAYLLDIWKAMRQAIDSGLAAEGTLPGGTGLLRKAKVLHTAVRPGEDAQTRENREVCAYAFASSEENASGGTVVTAPTCGACGVLPAVLRYMQETKNFSDGDIVRALAVGGLVGLVIKTNASISGAECGCQAEIGSACSMAAAALCELHGMGIDETEYAAEVAMEHHLGLTCDPVGGLVQIPCIERNAVAAMRAINAYRLADFLTSTRTISFDTVVETMLETGRDMGSAYRETSLGGLARNFHPRVTLLEEYEEDEV